MSDLSQHAFPRQQGPARCARRAAPALSCANWQIEAAYRMIQNNLDPAVAENPDELVVYGGIGKAARNWPCFDAILDSLRKLQPDETLLVQSGKPVGVFRTHAGAPRVLIANSNLVPKWATWEHFNELDRAGLMMYGQMTAGSWIYIGTQGIVQGTYETFAEAGRQHFGGDLAGPLGAHRRPGRHGRRAAAGRHLRRRLLAQHRVPADPHRLPPAHQVPRQAGQGPGRGAGADRAPHRAQGGGVDRPVRQRGRDRAANWPRRAKAGGIRPDIVTDQTSAHDIINGYLPIGWSVEQWQAAQKDPAQHARADAGRRRIVRGACPGDAGIPCDGHAHGGLRQQPAPGGQGLRRGQRLRLSRASCPPTSGRCSAAASARSAGWRCPATREDIRKTDAKMKELFPHNEHLHRWLDMAQQRISFQGLPARICWIGLGERHRAGLAFNEMVKSGELKAPIVIGRDHLDSGSVASPNRETEAHEGRQRRGERLAAAQCAAQHRQRRHLGQLPSRRRRRHGLLAACGRGDRVRRHAPRPPSSIERVLWNDPATGVMRHADAGYEIAEECAREHGLNLPMQAR